MTQPMTIGELIEHLKQFDPADFVMIECSDDYYSSALTSDCLDRGETVFTLPHDWTYKSEGGKDVPQHYPGGWNIFNGEDDRAYSEKRSCLIINARG